MKKIPCSVGIITLNSAKTLKYCLQSIRDFAEIIICDANSTDNTVKIAKSYGCKVIPQYRSKKKNIRAKDKSIIRNKTIKAATYEWYFWIDSDDYASKNLVSSIRKVVTNKNPQHLFWQVECKIKINDKLIKHSSSYPDLRVMLMNKKTGAKFHKADHEKIKLDESKYSIGRLKGYIYLCWSKNRVQKSNWWLNANQQLDRDFQSVKDQPWQDYWKWSVYFNLKTMAHYSLKALRNYLFYGFKDSMPPKIEFYRVLYHFKIMGKATLYKITKLL